MIVVYPAAAALARAVAPRELAAPAGRAPEPGGRVRRGVRRCPALPAGRPAPRHRLAHLCSPRRLFVRQYAAERAFDLVLVLDTSADAGETGGSTLDLTVRAATGLAQTYLRAHDRVGLVTFGGSLRWLVPAAGPGSSTGSPSRSWRSASTSERARWRSGSAWPTCRAACCRAGPSSAWCPRCSTTARSTPSGDLLARGLRAARRRRADQRALPAGPGLAGPAQTQAHAGARRPRPADLADAARGAPGELASLGVPVCRGTGRATSPAPCCTRCAPRPRRSAREAAAGPGPPGHPGGHGRSRVAGRRRGRRRRNRCRRRAARPAPAGAHRGRHTVLVALAAVVTRSRLLGTLTLAIDRSDGPARSRPGRLDHPAGPGRGRGRAPAGRPWAPSSTPRRRPARAPSCGRLPSGGTGRPCWRSGHPVWSPPQRPRTSYPQ